MQTGGAKKRIGGNNEKRHQYYQYLECVGGILFTVVSILFKKRKRKRKQKKVGFFLIKFKFKLSF